MEIKNRTTLDGAIDHLESSRGVLALTSEQRPYRRSLAVVNGLKAAGQTTVLAFWIVSALGAFPAWHGEPPFMLFVCLALTLVLALAGLLRKMFRYVRKLVRGGLGSTIGPPPQVLDASARVLKRVRAVVPGDSSVLIAWREGESDIDDAPDRTLEFRIDGGGRGLIEFEFQTESSGLRVQAELASQVVPVRFTRRQRFPHKAEQDLAVGDWAGRWLADQPGLKVPTLSAPSDHAGRTHILVEATVPEHDETTRGGTWNNSLVPVYLAVALPLMLPALIVFSLMGTWEWSFGSFADVIHQYPILAFSFLAALVTLGFWPRDRRTHRLAPAEGKERLVFSEAGVQLGEQQVDLDLPFFVRVYRTHDEDAHQTIGVELRGQRTQDGVSPVIRFRFASPGTAVVPNLPVMDMDVPRFDASEILGDLWPLLLRASQLHGLPRTDWGGIPEQVRRNAVAATGEIETPMSPSLADTEYLDDSLVRDSVVVEQTSTA